MKNTMLRAVVAALCLSTPAYSDSPTVPPQGRGFVGPILAAASNFGQGARRDFMAAGQNLPVMDFRDAVYWDDTDQGGRFVFTAANTRYPDHLARWGAGLSLTVNNGHPDYDAGATPTSPEAVAQFGRHAAQMVQRFPNIHSVEVGNEFNSANFVSGPLRSAGLNARAKAYAALLASVHSQVKAIRPEVRILGGGVHSIPTGHLAAQMAQGAGVHMDAVVLHPYDTPLEILRRQIEVMRRIPELARMPVEITEFGSQDPDRAASYLLQSYCQMALSGVTRAAWYPLNPRGDGYVPLFASQTERTSAGDAYLFATKHLQGKPVQAYRPDPFTYGCLFGDETLILWGAPRDLRVVRMGVQVTDAAGRASAKQRLSMEQALVLSAPNLSPRDVVLAPLALLADSYHQFGYPQDGAAQSAGDGFSRFGRYNDTVIALETMPGQDREGVPWVPYRGTDWDRGLRLLSTQMLPSGGGANPVQIVHTYQTDTPQSVDLVLRLAPVARSEDGVRSQVRANGAQLADQIVTADKTITLKGIALAAGDRIEISVGPNGTARGDVTDYRFQVFAARD